MKKQIFYTVITVLTIQTIILGAIILSSSSFEVRVEPFGNIIFREK